MRYGFWTPVFGGWLRNIPDEHMQPTWEYAKRLCQRAEKIGYDLTLVAELNLNDIKGVDQPALDAWSTAAALAAVTDSLELMVAVRPNFHQPALLAKQAANIDNISNGRLALNVVSSWWEKEATSYGLQFDQHDDRYGRTSEWLDVVDGLWSQKVFNHNGPRYKLEDAICEPKPMRKPVVYAGGESEAAKTMIANQCDAYVMHGDTVEVIAEKIADMRARREKARKPPMTFGMAAYAIVRDTEEEAKAEVARITTLDPNAPGFGNFDQWISGTQLEREMKIAEYSVSNRGLRLNLIGTADQIKDRIAAYEAAGLDLLLLQMSPQYEEMERFAAAVIN
ncbi:MAG: LLM class flavin-dependent oxidoreductase [Proteobacteria bacterium]|nr:LLM class flavin-dependent oxidoreductase [Pseudomonadota bacterium]